MGARGSQGLHQKGLLWEIRAWLWTKEGGGAHKGRMPDGGAVIIGSAPWKLSSKVHINGWRGFRAKDKDVKREVVATDVGRSFKRSWVMFVER
jgi:hypothetical protein